MDPDEARTFGTGRPFGVGGGGGGRGVVVGFRDWLRLFGGVACCAGGRGYFYRIIIIIFLFHRGGVGLGGRKEGRDSTLLILFLISK